MQNYLEVSTKFSTFAAMDYLEYKGYKGSVEYSKEDNCLFGKVQGMSKALILYDGQTLDEFLIFGCRQNFTQKSQLLWHQQASRSMISLTKPSRTN